MKCNCDKEFDNKLSLDGHKRKCKIWKDYINSILTYDFLYNEYIIEEKSANQIANELKIINAAGIINALKKHKIPNRSISQSVKMEKVIKSKKDTNLQKYGSDHNFNKDHPSRIKWQQRLLDEEGIVNVFQRDEVKKKSVISLYNNGKNKIPNGKSKSKIHLITLEILESLDIPFLDEKAISDGNTVYFYDAHILGTKKLIEVNGDFWHANPKIYKETDLVKLPGTPLLAKQIWYNDLKKKNMAEKYNYDILYLWESDFKCIENIINLIINFIKKEE